MIALLARDLRLAVRAGGGFGLALAFFVMFATLVPLAVGPQPERLAAIAPGAVWMGALLSCLLSLDRMFSLDWEDGSLDVLATAPLPLEAAAGAKALAHWIVTGLPLAALALPLGMMLGLPAEGWGPLALSLLAGTPALSLIGAFGAALTVGIRRGGLLLGLLVLPLYVPTLIYGAAAVRRGIEGLDASAPLLMLAGISFGAAAILPFACAAALRASLR